LHPQRLLAERRQPLLRLDEAIAEKKTAAPQATLP
jgi:hypothetical protein